MKLQIFVLGALAALAIGCQPAVEEVTAPEPTNVPFTGQVDESVTGTWKSQSGSTYVFQKDGAYVLDSVVRTPNGEMKTHSEGEWKIDGTKLLMKDENGNVVPYEIEKATDKLTLQVGKSLKHKTELTRQKG